MENVAIGESRIMFTATIRGITIEEVNDTFMKQVARSFKEGHVVISHSLTALTVRTVLSRFNEDGSTTVDEIGNPVEDWFVIHVFFMETEAHSKERMRVESAVKQVANVSSRVEN